MDYQLTLYFSSDKLTQEQLVDLLHSNITNTENEFNTSVEIATLHKGKDVAKTHKIIKSIKKASLVVVKENGL